ncbi:MAG: transporter related, partial [Anaerocolumna sp.]|nr:transporter related [Anaerocolumna sp.]
LNVGISIWIKRKVHKFQYSLKEALSHEERKKRYYFNTTHDFGYGKDIRLYQFNDQIMKNYAKDVDNYIGIHRKIKNREFNLSFLDLVCFLISNGLTYGLLINMVVNGMSIADFSMYITAVTSLSILLKKGSEELAFIINEGQYVYDFYEFLGRDLGEKGGEILAEKETLEIVFDNVAFKYPGTENYIIKDLNFTIHKGEKLAIVGINGAGKSTLVKLMTGLFDVTEGEIRINGIPINRFNKKELYAMFSVVFQDINILAFSVAENIACSSEKMNEERVNKAIEKVGLLDKINQLPKKLNHPMLKVIDEEGVEFSGGESQKLAIARALYKDGNMVIMDEPTAALDALAEAEIYENFSELVKGKTAVYISHRLASTKFCDKIALFDKEGLKEYGNHEELMTKQGDYYNMFTIQGKYYKEEGVING